MLTRYLAKHRPSPKFMIDSFYHALMSTKFPQLKRRLHPITDTLRMLIGEGDNCLDCAHDGIKCDVARLGFYNFSLGA